MQKAASVDTGRLGLFIPKGLGHCLIQKIAALYYTCMHFPFKMPMKILFGLGYYKLPCTVVRIIYSYYFLPTHYE